MTLQPLAALSIVIALLALQVVHELGHASCAKALGLHPRPFYASVWRWGVSCWTDTPSQDRSIACAGPLATILAGLALVYAGLPLAGWSGILLFGILQLLPRRGFDGARIYGRNRKPDHLH